MARASTAPAADGRQLEDEPQPPRGHRAGAEAGVQPHRAAAHRRRGGRAAAVHRPPQRADARSTATSCSSATARRTCRRTPAGAYTGDISGAMLAKLGCTYVVVGHSERRQYHDEDDALVNAKVKAALANGHRADPVHRRGPGGPRGRRARGAHAGPARRRRWPGSPPSRSSKVVVAYEPVWAIGTGKTATPEDAQEVIGAIRARLAETYGRRRRRPVRILYGGSVKAANIAGDHGAAGHRRRAGRRRQPGRRGVREDLPVPGAHRSLIAAILDSARPPVGAAVTRICPGAAIATRGLTPTMPIWFAYTLIVLLIITSVLLTLLILLHRGKGGGLSSMFGGGVTLQPGRLVGGREEPGPLHGPGGHHLVRLHRRASVSGCKLRSSTASPDRARSVLDLRAVRHGPRVAVSPPTVARRLLQAIVPSDDRSESRGQWQRHPWHPSRLRPDALGHRERSEPAPRRAVDLLVRQRPRTPRSVRGRRPPRRRLGLPPLRLPGRPGPAEPARPRRAPSRTRRTWRT